MMCWSWIDSSRKCEALTISCPGPGITSLRRCTAGPGRKIAKTTPCKVEWTPARSTLAALRPGQKKGPNLISSRSSVGRVARRDDGWPRHDVLRRGWHARERYGRGARPSRDRRLHDAWRLRGDAWRRARGVQRPCGGARRLHDQPYFSPDWLKKRPHDLRRSPDNMLTTTRQVCCG